MTTVEGKSIARQLWQTYLAGTNIPNRKLENFQTRDNQSLVMAREATSGLLVLKPRLLTLAGTPGVGKTHLAAAAARIMAEQGKRVAWFRTSDYLDQIRAAPFEDLANRMMDIGYQHLIVLDDLMAAHFRTEWSHERINQLVDMAWERPKQAMIITTNMPAEEIPPRILDRLTDRECGRVCVMAGVSWRQGG